MSKIDLLCTDLFSVQENTVKQNSEAYLTGGFRIQQAYTGKFLKPAFPASDILPAAVSCAGRHRLTEAALKPQQIM